MVSRFTLDTATAFLFGQDVRSLEAGLPHPNSVFSNPLGATEPADAHPSSAFADAFQEAQIITALRTRFGKHWPLREFWSDKLAGPMSVVRGFLDPILKEAVAKKRAKGQTSVGDEQKHEDGEREVQEGELLLDHLVNYTDDHTILRDEILNITTAGRGIHPEILAKLREEILRLVGPMQRPTYDAFRDMKYLRARGSASDSSSRTMSPPSSSFAFSRDSPASPSPWMRASRARPTAAWQTDDMSWWKAKENIRPRSHLTLFVVVRSLSAFPVLIFLNGLTADNARIWWTLGTDGRGKSRGGVIWRGSVDGTQALVWCSEPTLETEFLAASSYSLRGGLAYRPSVNLAHVDHRAGSADSKWID
ncbi:hypothetical protein B0H13DRAFT_1867749 [Mycena leptocephala]|nr:hypothetical protein B0H13DRAFT_1867749 [Mycena leptocephala]